MNPDDDVPSPIDLRDPQTAATWTAEADVKRPWRRELRAAIVARVVEVARVRTLDAARLGILDAARLHVLELGAGPGLLAEAILDACDIERYTLFDFSQPMLDLARQRLGDRAAAQYVLGDFLSDTWPQMLAGPYDAIVTMQAVHELRHKRRAARLYAQARPLLRAGGVLIVCDHAPTDPRPLASTAEEQHAALAAAGFANVTTVAEINGLYVVSSST